MKSSFPRHTSNDHSRNKGLKRPRDKEYPSSSKWPRYEENRETSDEFRASQRLYEPSASSEPGGRSRQRPRLPEQDEYYAQAGALTGKEETPYKENRETSDEFRASQLSYAPSESSERNSNRQRQPLPMQDDYSVQSRPGADRPKTISGIQTSLHEHREQSRSIEYFRNQFRIFSLSNPRDGDYQTLYDLLKTMADSCNDRLFLENLEEWCEHAKTEDIGFILHNLGHSVAKVVVDNQKRKNPAVRPFPLMPTELVTRVLAKLLKRHSDRSIAKAISVAFGGVAKMGQYGILDTNRRIPLTYIDDSLSRLMQKDNVTSEGIGNTLYAIGKIAEAQLLQKGLLGTHAINLLLKKLHSLISDLYDQVEDARTSQKSVSTDLQKKISMTIQHISMALYGIGRMAEAELIGKDTIDIECIYDLLSEVKPEDILEAQHISNTIYGVGRMVEAQCLTRKSSKGDSVYLGIVCTPLLQKLQVFNRRAPLQETSMALYGLGLIAEAGFLMEESLDILSINELLLILETKANAQHISMSLYGIGFMVAANSLQKNAGLIDVMAIINLLSRLSLQEATAQQINNAVYGVSHMVEAKFIATQLPNGERVSLSEQCNALLKQLYFLSGAGRANPQEISTILYSMGRIAAAGFFAKDSLSASEINGLLQDLTAQSDTPATARNISSALYGVGQMAEAGAFPLQSLDPIWINKLLSILSQTPLNMQDISNALYGVGKMTGSGSLIKGSLSIEDVNLFLKSLDELNAQRKIQEVSENLLTELRIQSVSNTLYGIAKIIESGFLAEGRLEVLHINNLLKSLSQQGHVDVRHISNLLYSVGLMAEKGFLDKNSVDITPINLLLLRLNTEANINIQDISNALYGVGIMAEANCLTQGSLDISCIQDLAKKIHVLTQQQLENQTFKDSQQAELAMQGISNALYGVGRMAEAKRLTRGSFTFISSLLQDLHILIKYSGNTFKARHISGALYGASKIAEAKLVEGYALDVTDANDFLLILSKQPNMNAHEISSALYGIGKMFEANSLGSIEGESLSAAYINDLLGYLCALGKQKEIIALNISSSLYGLAKIAQAEAIDIGILNIRFINNLLQHLNAQNDITPQNISMVFYSIGKIASKNYFTPGMLTAKYIKGSLLNLSRQSSMTTQSIGNTLYGLGKMTEAGIVPKKSLPVNCVNYLLRNLCHLSQLTYDNAQEISNALYGIGRMMEAGSFDQADKLDTTCMYDLLSSLMEQQPEFETAQHISNALYGMGKLLQFSGREIRANVDAVNACIGYFKYERLENSAAVQILFYLRQARHVVSDLPLLEKIAKKAIEFPEFNPIQSIQLLVLLSGYPRDLFLQEKTLPDLFFWVLAGLQKISTEQNQNLAHRFRRYDRLFTQIKENLQQNSPELYSDFCACFYKDNTRDEPEDMGVEPEPLQEEAQSPLVMPSMQTPRHSHTRTNLPLFFPYRDDAPVPSSSQTQSLPSASTHSSAAAQPASQARTTQAPRVLGEEVAADGGLNPNRVRAARTASQPPVQPAIARLPEFREPRYATQHEIYVYIRNNDVEGLKAFLQYPYDDNVMAGPHYPIAGTPRAAIPRLLHQHRPPLVGAQHVKKFFENISEESLRRLLCSEGIHSHLFVLFRILDRHDFHTLSKRLWFRQMYSMPLAELKQMIKKLCHPLQLHVDSEGLINAVNAISLLQFSDLDKTQEFIDIQRNLLEEGIRFHESRHHYRVVEKLQGYLNLLEQEADCFRELDELSELETSSESETCSESETSSELETSVVESSVANSSAAQNPHRYFGSTMYSSSNRSDSNASSSRPRSAPTNSR